MSSLNHGLEKWITKMLQPIVQRQQSYFKDSINLKNQLVHLTIPPGGKLFTCDATLHKHSNWACYQTHILLPLCGTRKNSPPLQCGCTHQSNPYSIQEQHHCIWGHLLEADPWSRYGDLPCPTLGHNIF